MSEIEPALWEQQPGESARAYAAFMKRAVPVIRTVLPAVQGELSVRDVPRRLAAAARALGRHPLATVRDAAGTYDSLLRRALPSDLTRGPVAGFTSITE